MGGWKGGSTTQWRKTREAVLLANADQHGGVCRLALPGEWRTRSGVARCTGVADCVHHTRGKGVTGDDPRYMVAACTPCNLKVGDPNAVPDPEPAPRTVWV